MAHLDRSALNDHANDEDADVEDDSVLPRQRFGEKTRVQATEPCTQFKDCRHPAFLGRVVDPVSHVFGMLARARCLNGL